MTVKYLGQVNTLQGEGLLEDPDGRSTQVSYILQERTGTEGHEEVHYTLLGRRTLNGTIRAARLPLMRDGVLHLRNGLRINLLLKASDGHVAQVDSTGPPF
ncbi:MAG: hypothetical protein WB523_01295 [Candidatus Sulfotelmatobacter sp.]